jgi:hypothetical protein
VWNSETGHATRALALPFKYDLARHACLLAGGRADAFDARTISAKGPIGLTGLDAEIAAASSLVLPREAKALHARLLPLRLPILTQKLTGQVLGRLTGLDKAAVVSAYAVALTLASYAAEEKVGADRLALELAARAVLELEDKP